MITYMVYFFISLQLILLSFAFYVFFFSKLSIKKSIILFLLLSAGGLLSMAVVLRSGNNTLSNLSSGMSLSIGFLLGFVGIFKMFNDFEKVRV
ncbi:MAG: hypothetical protein M1315_01375 [Candidatus Thermoplasmatota archaeon]|nr:hypothetical protein [Candidatus Thermoplasmatota archaeon]